MDSRIIKEASALAADVDELLSLDFEGSELTAAVLVLSQRSLSRVASWPEDVGDEEAEHNRSFTAAQAAKRQETS